MKSILIFVHDLYEDLELWYPKIRLEEAGFTTVLAGPEANRTYLGKHGYPCKTTHSFQNISAKDFAGLFIPGGYAPDKLRRDKKVLDLTREFYELHKMIAFICHAGWVPISAKILKDKKATSTLAIRDDMENAGCVWLDDSAIIDGCLVSSRNVDDLPHFAKAMLKVLSQKF